LIRWTLHPSQGAHTSHLRTLSKIKFSSNQHPTPQLRFVRGSRTLYIPFRVGQHLVQQKILCDDKSRDQIRGEIAKLQRKRCDSATNKPIHALIMGELYEDRRQEPRFTTAGKYRLQNVGGGGTIEGRVLDLSLNGVLLEYTNGTKLQAGTRHALVLEFEGQPPFQGDTLLVWANDSHLGIEFYDMDPQNFAALTALIEALDRANRVATHA